MVDPASSRAAPVAGGAIAKVGAEEAEAADEDDDEADDEAGVEAEAGMEQSTPDQPSSHRQKPCSHRPRSEH